LEGHHGPVGKKLDVRLHRCYDILRLDREEREVRLNIKCRRCCNADGKRSEGTLNVQAISPDSVHMCGTPDQRHLVSSTAQECAHGAPNGASANNRNRGIGVSCA
jgi:hypothetical protein